MIRAGGSLHHDDDLPIIILNLPERSQLPVQRIRILDRVAHLDVQGGFAIPRYEIHFEDADLSDIYMISSASELQKHNVLHEVVDVSIPSSEGRRSKAQVAEIEFIVRRELLLRSQVESSHSVERERFCQISQIRVNCLKVHLLPVARHVVPDGFHRNEIAYIVHQEPRYAIEHGLIPYMVPLDDILEHDSSVYVLQYRDLCRLGFPCHQGQRKSAVCHVFRNGIVRIFQAREIQIFAV